MKFVYSTNVKSYNSLLDGLYRNDTKTDRKLIFIFLFLRIEKNEYKKKMVRF